MIVPMLKYAFIMHHSDYQDFLKDIRELGVLDIVEKQTSISSELKEKLSKLKNADEIYNFLSKRHAEAKKVTEASEKEIIANIGNADAEQIDFAEKDFSCDNPLHHIVENRKIQLKQEFFKEKESTKDSISISGIDIIDKVSKLQSEQEHIKQLEHLINKEIKHIEPWGDFSIDTLHKLAANGVKIRLYICSDGKYKPEWEENYDIYIINNVNHILHFAIILRDDNKPEIEAEEIKIPEEPVSKLFLKRHELFERDFIINLELDFIALNYMSVLKEHLNILEEEIDYQNVLNNTESAAADNLKIIEGYIPKVEKQKLNEYLEKERIVYFASKPTQNDKVPILLKNNRFARLYEPIGKLFSLPSYTELDLTPFFAPFFMMFFGFCLGDVGYGLVILIGTTIYKFKAKPEMKPMLSLIQFLGLGTIIFGFLTGTLFGISLLQVESLGRIRDLMLDSQKTFYLALGLGLFQILFGIILRAVNNTRMYGWQAAISPIGWFLLIVFLLDTALLNLLPSVSIYVIYVALGMIVFFSDPSVGILARIGKGIWDLYGITGIFGDVLSYIRLFALGMSSAILGFVINDISLQIYGAMPIIGPVFFVIFLIIGHSANLMISSLGSFVHPMRLTFVEFYKNANFTGGGREYKPFKYKQLIKKGE